MFRRAETPTKRLIQVLIWVLAAAAISFLLAKSGLYRCPVYWGLGIQCPGCGMVRAAVSLAQFDLTTAIAYNPLIFFVGGYAAVFCFDWVFLDGNIRKNKWFTRIFIAVLLLFWGYRIAAFLLGKNPAFYYENAVLPRIIHAVSP